MTPVTDQTCTFALRPLIPSFSSLPLHLRPACQTANGTWSLRGELGKEQLISTLGCDPNSLSTLPNLKVWFSKFLFPIIHLFKNDIDISEAYQTINEAWKAFENSLIAISGIISYAPVFTDYFYQGLVSFHDDNVQYMEIRTTIPQVLTF